ncbi:MAG: FAD-dependent oxidoreductase [Clostridia bacterium]|nr:FAD-dependent oxidoreductase [Clostridia bacterium]
MSKQPRSLWQETYSPPTFKPLHWGEKTKVLIIGGGIAGILTAYRLHQAGVPYILLEQGRILQGTTAHTTAKITSQHGLLYQKLLRREGMARARQYLSANEWAVGEYERLSREYPCDFRAEPHFVYSQKDENRLKREMDALAALGFEAEFCRELPLPIKTMGAVCFPHQASFHPLKFLGELARDLNIRENTHVLELQGTNAITERGGVHAEKIIVATHFPFINRHGGYFLRLYQHRSYLMALSGVKPMEGMYLDEDPLGMTFRSYKDLLLIGGGGHRTGKEGGNWAELRAFAAAHYPAAKEEYFWAAQDCMSLDQMPYIGQYGAHTEELLVASGFNKWGMTGAMIASRLLADRVMGKENEFQALFEPKGRLLRPKLILNALSSAAGLLNPSPKRCPHLGCALKWNKAEHSWDCPCHGSRFSSKGECLNNPANEDLYH